MIRETIEEGNNRIEEGFLLRLQHLPMWVGQKHTDELEAIIQETIGKSSASYQERTYAYEILYTWDRLCQGSTVALSSLQYWGDYYAEAREVWDLDSGDCEESCL